MLKRQTPEFSLIFSRLRAILEAHASKFVITADREDYYCLQVSHSRKFKKGFPVAWVKISKSYVSFHFMPIYFSPTLKRSLSPRLAARMQGKSCFNFKIVDEELFGEIRKLTEKGFELSTEVGAL